MTHIINGRLFFGGRVLDDLNEKLYTYNIDNGTVIILQERRIQQQEATKYVICAQSLISSGRP